MFYLKERVKAVLILGLLLVPVNVYALGFGALSLHSHLNEGLKAEVPLVLNASDDAKAVQVELASQKEYRQLGLQWQRDLGRIRIEIQGKHSGAPVVQLRSAGVIRSPLLSIVLKARKAGRGTYFRHFQLLLDLPDSVALPGQQPAVVPLRTQPQSSLVTDPVSEDEGWARIWRYGPVQRGDSISEIAYRLRRDKRFSNRQVMLSLFENNPDSFVDGDINHLKKGSWLTVPRGEVVRESGSREAMQRLAGLLNRSKPEPKPEAQPEPAVAAVKQDNQELRYSGRISMNGAAATGMTDEEKQGLDTKFDAIHEEMMSGKLQMASLGKSVSGLKQSVEVIQEDIHALKRDVEIIKQRTAVTQSASFSNWQIALFTLLAAIFGALVATLLRRKPDADDLPAAEAVAVSEAAEEDLFAGEQASTPPLADEVVQLLNQTEESLGQCEFDEAEQMLKRIDQLAPGSLRALVLKAQLLHETDRHEERNALINSVSESSEKDRWENFCQLLPSHVWNACFGDGMAAGESDGER